MIRLRKLPALLLVLAVAAPLSAATTQIWEMNTFEDFLQGKFEGVSLTRQGRLQPAPELEEIFTSDQPAIWAVARGGDGSLYVATGHRGRVYRIDPSGNSEIYWEAEEPEVFALALDGEGRLYAATAPEGKVYRIEDGKAEEYFDPGATYIWSLAFAPDGALFVGVGEGGRIYRVTGAGAGESYYETGQMHVTALAIDAAGNLLAGTEPNGILYRISAKDKAFVLYDANFPEIRSLAPQSSGLVYAAALGGSVAKQKSAATQAAARKAAQSPVAHTSITVTAAQADIELQPEEESSAKQTASTISMAPTVPVIEVAGVDKSALYRIHPDHMVETLWKSTEENVYDVLPHEDRLLFSTDKKGRLYEMDGDGRVTLLAQTDEGEAVRLLEDGENVLLATANMGKVYRVQSAPRAEGVYESPVHDAARSARWGSLAWEASGGGDVVFQTRSGNSARPDRTWTEWSDPLTDPEGSAIESPNARFIQWRAQLRGGDGDVPALDGVRLAYLPQNAPPRVVGLVVSTEASPESDNSASTAPASSSTAAYSITVTDTGEEGASTVSGTSTQSLAKSTSDKVRISWHTEDLDNDRLIYELQFRGAGESKWKVIEEDLETTTYAIDSDSLADGRYYFRVVASDRRDNPPEWARKGDRTSSPVLVDHTPPVVKITDSRADDGRVQVTLEARDAASSLLRCEYALDAGEWTPLAAEDGIIDSRVERFTVKLGRLYGEHLLVFRVYDSARNAGLAKELLELPDGP